MFKKILIANRGEIACRISRTLRSLGVVPVAVYSRADSGSLHVALAGESFEIGDGTAAQSYLSPDRIFEAARQSGAEAIHPGYGFLSENADFAERCEQEGITFIGPTPEQMRSFGLKHTARDLAARQGVPLPPGSGLLADAEEALKEADAIGYPVMIKSSAGGGGIGMRVVHAAGELTEAFHSVTQLARGNFGNTGIFLEKYVEDARHIEVQIFGDGAGRVLALGERDCTMQRRNQKVFEETPAPLISEVQRANLHSDALRLAKAIQYRSAGTVEFIFDAQTGRHYFLEMNTRLQVEHGVTEAVFGIDLVDWMVRLAAGDSSMFETPLPKPAGHSIQARVYAENPLNDFRPSSGVVTRWLPPKNARCDTWIETGANVSPYYDPLLAKIIVHAEDRQTALGELENALRQTCLEGIESNLDYLRTVAGNVEFSEARHTTRFLSTFPYQAPRIEVVEPGTQTSVQDYPGRLGYWAVGVPPSGPMDSLAFRLGNTLLGNSPEAAGLECTVSGPTLRFHTAATLCLTGAHMPATLNGKQTVPYWKPFSVERGDVLSIGRPESTGCRSYLTVLGGIQCPLYLGSRATFALGKFGGHAGRTLLPGDYLPLAHQPTGSAPIEVSDDFPIPQYGPEWEIGVCYGPHGAPDFFTPASIKTFFEAKWEVHYNSARTGIRLIGPKPEWARPDGGEAGLHPSNIHDCAYAVGAIDFTGDMPIILGLDGPSLGGFVCPATIVGAELWKIGQLRPGDRIRFKLVTEPEARLADAALERFIAAPAPRNQPPAITTETHEVPKAAALNSWAATPASPEVVYRPAGDSYLLIEYGEMVLDLVLRFRVHALMQGLVTEAVPGILDLTPGIRSLQVHYDPRVLPRKKLVRVLERLEDDLGDTGQVTAPTRTVHLPLSWDDPSTQLAIEKYMNGAGKDAPWCPSNIEFIRRINGLKSVEDVKRILFDATYLVLGLGDVYLGAPVATPLDPRHRLVTTKYNPARTWTPENAVGIGGAYLCVYGMEGPGGYQFVGRTLQMWNRHRETPDFSAEKPWLLRFFDQIRFYPVTNEELTRIREDFPVGRYHLKTEEGTFSLSDYQAFLAKEADSIAEFKKTQQKAFDEERERWSAAGRTLEPSLPAEAPEDTAALPEGCRDVLAPVPGSVWKLVKTPGEKVAQGDVLLILESMKMEISVPSPVDGVLESLPVQPGAEVGPGQRLAIVREQVETPPETTMAEQA